MSLSPSGARRPPPTRRLSAMRPIKGTAITLHPDGTYTTHEVELDPDDEFTVRTALEALQREVAALRPVQSASIAEAARMARVSTRTARRRIREGVWKLIPGTKRVDLSSLRPTSEDEVAALAYRARSSSASLPPPRAGLPKKP